MVSLDTRDSLTAEEIVDLSSEYTLWSWSAQKAVKPIPMVKGQGVYFWDASGKRYLDFNSQLMCVNIGHGDRRVIEAIQRQAEELGYAGAGMATPVPVFPRGPAGGGGPDRRPPPLAQRAGDARRDPRDGRLQVPQPAVSGRR